MKLLTKKANADYTKGPLYIPYLSLAMSLFISNLVQRLYNVADQAIIGRFSGDVNALAAIGRTSVLNTLLINTILGLSVGVIITFSRALGNKDNERASKIMHTSILFGLVVSAVLATVGFFVSRPVLLALGTKPEHIDLATVYIKIIFLGLPAHVVFAFAEGILRAKGKNAVATTISVVSGVMNVVLNIIFVVCFHMSVAGVALATVISQVFTSITALILLYRDKTQTAFRVRQLKIDGSSLRDVLTVGVPNSLQLLVYSVGGIFISATQNTLPLDVLNASAAAGGSSGLLSPIASSFGVSAVSVLVAQNYGAKNYRRIKRVMRNAMLTMLGIFSVIIPLFMIFSKNILSLFLDPAVENYTTLLAYAAPLLILQPIEHFISGFVNVYTSTARAIGHSASPLLTSIIVHVGFSIPWCLFIFRLFESPIAFFFLGICLQSLNLIFNFILTSRHLRKMKKKFEAESSDVPMTATVA